MWSYILFISRNIDQKINALRLTLTVGEAEAEAF